MSEYAGKWEQEAAILQRTKGVPNVQQVRRAKSSDIR